jgi:hypothetical protein
MEKGASGARYRIHRGSDVGTLCIMVDSGFGELSINRRLSEEEFEDFVRIVGGKRGPKEE